MQQKNKFDENLIKWKQIVVKPQSDKGSGLQSKGTELNFLSLLKVQIKLVTLLKDNC